MTPTALLERIAAGESLTLELKKSTAEKDRACRSLCALANGQGGQVVFGVTPAGKVPGQKVTDRWETQPAVGCSVENLDSREIVVTLEESIRRGRSEDPGTRDTLGILRGLGLLVNGEQISRAAVALFCKDEIPLPDYPQFNLRLARFKGTTRDEFLDNRQYSGNAFALMRRAERFLIDWLPVAGKIVPGQMARIDTPALPVEAVREALANAFIHRDYTSPAGSVAVALYDDRLEIISPGELHFGLTPKMLFEPHESKPWNPWIAKIFHRRGLIETWGRGTLKIASLMQAVGLPVPTLQERTESVLMTFRLPDHRGGVNVGVNVGANVGVNRLLAYIQANPGQRAGDMAGTFTVTQRTIERWLKQLKEDGLIEFRGAAKTGGYYRKNE